MSTKKSTPQSVQQDTEIEGLKKQVAFLESKTKSQSESIHLLKSMSDSLQAQLGELGRKVRKLMEVSGVTIL